MFMVEANWEATVNVSTELVVPLAGTVVELGLNAQEIPGVAVEQKKLTPPLNPFTGVTVTLKVAEPPTFTVALVGLTDPVKSQTCNCAVAVCVTGELAPVTFH